MDAGYSVREAKEKIGAVVLTEIYDVLKENQPYDERQYRLALEEMVKQSIDFEEVHSISTEWDELVQQGYEVQENQDNEVLLDCWWRAWKIFQTCKALAQHLERKEDLKWVESQLKSFYYSMEEADYYNDLYDDFRMPVRNQL